MRLLAKLAALAASTALIVACGGGGDGGGSASLNNSSTNSFTLTSGVAQKGPLQIGSTVTIAELDENLNPTGKIFLTEVEDNLGNFRLGSTIGTRLALILAQGFFMDENTGDFTSSAITLRGISDLSIETSPSVNVLTTLQYIRLKNLVLSGESYENAYTQSQNEVLNAFGIDPNKIEDMGSLFQMKINGSSDADAVLLSISALIGKAAEMRGSNSTAAQLSDIINTIASDISQTGELNTASIRSELVAAHRALDLDSVRNNVQRFYALRGITVAAPIFEDWVSKDGQLNLPNRTKAIVDDFSLDDIINAEPNLEYTSNQIQISGLAEDEFTTLRVSNGASIIKNSTPIAGINTTVKNGDIVTLKKFSSSYGSSTDVTLTIGSKNSTWSITSQSPSIVNPNNFEFVDVINSIPGNSYTSSTVTVTGLNTGEVAFVSSTDGSSIKVNGIIPESSQPVVTNGDVITLSATSPAYGNSKNYTLNVGSKSATWTITAQRPRLVTPNLFTFNSIADEISSVITSNEITISGLANDEVAEASVSTSNLNNATLFINGIATTSSFSIVKNGDVLSLRTTLPNVFGSDGLVALTVGTLTSNWQVSVRNPSVVYYKRRGAPNTFLDNWYSSGTPDVYYAVPFTATTSNPIRYFSMGVNNGVLSDVYLYSNNSADDKPDSLLGTATINNYFTSTSSYTYPEGQFTRTGQASTFTDANNTVYWLSTMVQGKFGSGINLIENNKYWIVFKWNNNQPHDSRVEASTGASFDFSQMQGSPDAINWSNISSGIFANGAVPAMFFTD